jgi:hypothetical protein
MRAELLQDFNGLFGPIGVGPQDQVGPGPEESGGNPIKQVDENNYAGRIKGFFFPKGGCGLGASTPGSSLTA